MQCGRCGEPMEEGRVEVHATPGAFLFVGWAPQDLYWYDGAAKRKSRRRIVDTGEARVAFGCRPCGIVTIDTTAPLEPRKPRKRRRGARRRG